MSNRKKMARGTFTNILVVLAFMLFTPIVLQVVYTIPLVEPGFPQILYCSFGELLRAFLLAERYLEKQGESWTGKLGRSVFRDLRLLLSRPMVQVFCKLKTRVPIRLLFFLFATFLLIGQLLPGRKNLFWSRKLLILSALSIKIMLGLSDCRMATHWSIC